ncbi:fructosamine kinase family protein [Synechococcus sp. BDU 130192]|uniref:fructosamine kinase family protein n=1 Tax=Synechococcus sp. BDU 130192 TaxID=2042059 RepID=UPI000C06B9A0|nr:fructosamine kinase family protein [Synechococcus sp. BDU 130192]
MRTSLGAIAEHIAATTGQPFTLEQQRSVGGGCINQGYCLAGFGQRYFVKLNRPNQTAMFAAEALALQQMGATQTIRVPKPICWGETESNSYIVLEWIDLGGGSGEAWQAMGRHFAELHRRGTAEKFGWDRPNTIGSTPQMNDWQSNWAEFWAEQRLGYQLRLARRKGGDFPEPQRIIEGVRRILRDHQPQPSLVHGDLWSGNAAVTAQGEPIIFDPAAYYGDREVDIAMTELFGGFPGRFYQGYNEAWPLDSGYGDRRDLYNLYHVLNHFNLFGGGYGNQAKRIIQQLF